MSRASLLRWASPLALLLAGGCAALPAAGPSAAAMQNDAQVDVIRVTPASAASAADAADAAGAATVAHAVAVLRAPVNDTAMRFASGDVIDVTLWSFSPWPGGSAGLSNAAPGAIALGSYTLPADGAIMLPYAGRVGLAGLTLEEGQAAISRAFAQRRILQSPTAMIKVAASPRDNILVTGSVGSPRSLPWTPAGMTLAQAISQAIGDGNAVLGQGDMSRSDAAVRVAVLRDATAIEVPIAVALEQRIALHPGDRVVVRKAPALEVTVLGGGARKDGVFGFGKQTNLSNVLAEASGLDSGVADAHAVFVLRKRPGATPVLYDFAWNRAEGLIAAHQFPMENGDLVYIAEAPIVPIQKVIGILFQVTLPAQILK